MRKGGDVSDPQEMAEKLMSGSQNNGQNLMGQMPGMGNMMGMGMNQPNFGTFGNNMNPFMFSIPQQPQPNQEGQASLPPAQQNVQSMI